MRAAASLRDVSYRYPNGPGAALDAASLDVRPGEVVVLAGPSGSGKTTLLRALAGLVPHFHGGVVSGGVHVAGLDLAASPPGAAARHVGILFQEAETQGVLARALRDVAFSLQTRGVPAGELLPRAQAALAEVDAAHLAERELASLSAGERQRVALASVLAPRPPVLLLDEPTGQLDDPTAERVADVLRRRADDGCAVVVAEHRLDRVEAIADRIVALDGGRVVPFAAEEPVPSAGPRSSPGLPLLTASGLSVGHGGRAVLSEVELELAEGEAVALLGPNGSGKTTLLRALAGLAEPLAGRIFLAGRDVTREPAERRFPDVSLLPQDPLRYLLCERVDAEVAFALEALGEPADAARATARRLLAPLGLAGAADRHPRDLSVGERERVALAAALVASPRVVLLDEPTRGLDAARRSEVAALVRGLAEAGAAVLVATHDGDVAAACCSRAVELARGRAVEREGALA